METVIITGNTYPVREKLASLGGKWNKDAKGWEIPKFRESEAKQIMASAPKSTLSTIDKIAIAARKRGDKPGTCFACGEKCKYPYTECWDCKEEIEMGY